MRRRDFVKAIAGTAAAWPPVAHAQKGSNPVIGFLNLGTSVQWAHLAAAFRSGLQETGYTEGQNVTIEYRWAEDQSDRLPPMASELASRRVTVIACGGGDPPVLAAKAATTTIPIVCTTSDPIESGIVKSLNRPEGNVTGVASFAMVTGSKRLSLLRELKRLTTVAVLTNPKSPSGPREIEALQKAAMIQGERLLVLNATSEPDIDSAFATLREREAGGLLVQSGLLFTARREKIVALAARYAVPTIYAQREFVDIGGLMSYGVNFIEIYRQLGVYTGRILKGEKPADLPILQPTKFDFVVNLKAAKALGLVVPPSLIALADEVVE